MGGMRNSTKKKQTRCEVRKNVKQFEACPHCKRRVADLDEHIKKLHPFRCARCGRCFTEEQQWKHHMRDQHGLKDDEAVKDDRKKKVDRWLKKTPGPSETHMGVGPGAAVSATGALAMHRNVCEACGAEAMLPTDLTFQGLSFSCAMLGRPCAGPAAAGRMPGMATPAAGPFAAPAAAAMMPASMSAPAPALGLGTAGPCGATAGFIPNLAPAQAPSLPCGLSGGFPGAAGAPPALGSPAPPVSGAAAVGGAAHPMVIGSMAAADIPVPSDDEDL